MNNFKIIASMISVFFISSCVMGKSGCLATGDYFEIIKQSKIQYNIKYLEGNVPIAYDKLVDYLYPQKEKHVKYPLVVTDKLGKILRIEEYSFKDEAKKLLQKGFENLNNNNYKKAINLFNKALTIDRKIYPAYIGLGDCYLKLRNGKTAIANYKKATEFNPNDYYCFLKLGKGYISLQKYKNAINPLINALVLKPRDKQVLSLLKQLEKKNIIFLPDISFKPKAFVDKRGGAVYVFFSKKQDQGIWYPYILTKAVWLFEPGFKDKGLGEKWVADADVCAFENTLFFYFNQKNLKKILPNVKMDRLVDIQESRMLEEYAYYEMGTRMYPDLMLLMPSSIKRKLKQFIQKYVVVKR